MSLLQNERWPEIVTAISTVIVAMVAVGVSVWQGFVARRHNRLSVTPTIRFDTYLDTSKLLLINTGVGPAIIEKMIVTVDGKNVEEYELLHAAFRRLGIQGADWITYQPDRREAMAVGEKIVLFERPEIDVEFQQRINEALRRLEIHIFYESIYKDSFSAKWSGSRD